MTLRINYNLASIIGQANLRNLDRLQGIISQRLTSGERIQKAGDDPTSLVLANQLQHHYRAAVQATDNAETGVSMLQTAEGAMDEGSAILNKMRALVIQAGNRGTLDATQLAALQNEFNNEVASLNRIATGTRFGNTFMLQGDFADNTLSDAAKTYYESCAFNFTRLPGGAQGGSTITIGAPTASLARESMSVTLETAGNPALKTATINGVTQNGTLLTFGSDSVMTVTGPLGSKNIVVTPVTTISDFVGLVNASTEETGLRADYDESSGQLTVESKNFGSGVMAIVSPIMSGASVGLLDTDAASAVLNPLEPNRDVYELNYTTGGPPSTATSTIQGSTDASTSTTLNAVDGKEFRIFGNGNAATLTMSSSTTFQDVVDFVNAHTDETGAVADFDAATGKLRITGRRGNVYVSSEAMTSPANNIGLLDLNVSVPTSNGVVKTTSSTNPTLNVSFVDAGGNTQTVTLTLDSSTEDGLSFVNLLPGPENNPPYSGWEAGAIRVKLKDTSDGSFGSALVAPTTSYTAKRLSSRFLQTGGFADTRNRVEIADLRVAALGASAFQTEYNGTDPDKPLTAKGYHSLQDLVDARAIEIGDANDALTMIEGATDEWTNARGLLGALQANSIDSAVETLRKTTINLEDAESRLRDTDFAIESAQYTKNNILMQATTAMLAQANQVPMSLLQLLSRR